ncbi:hypothetical protein [Hymenobacter cellulosivorans]|uniref:STAS/SEC14 domain-containing protein n=1 Tax=Hymenobacter cellulosivorans TaxID=2932249 RepID=A0ABY4F5I4_9BACT|nr:hypothetical protein [Hymenobacter cellulosivorans]UOQ51778.1 hypothetical protein MUN80_18690 [Hymenobacter cellulosivorans]
MQLLASYPHLSLYLHEEGVFRALEAQWQGFMSSSVLRQTILEALAQARQQQITAWIADDRLLGPVRPADLEWIAQQMLPELVDIGLRRFARVEAADPLNKLLIGQAQDTAEPLFPFEMRTFTDVQAARLWACS